MVRLHGDVKPDHILIDTHSSAALVDWEACARGPAVVDEADIAFRVIRDLTYADAPIAGIETFMPGSLIHVVALAWRLALWLDRRYDTVTDDLASLLEKVAGMPTMNGLTDAAVEIVGLARVLGTQYRADV